MILPSNEQRKAGDSTLRKTQGIAVLEMDDVEEGGNAEHQAALASIAKNVTFGKSRCVYGDKEGTLFNGRRWWQDKNYNVYHTMNEYCAERLWK